jgi:hypothetical protein
LSAIETCKEYKNILFGYQHPIIVFTDHKNNTFNGLKAYASDRVLHTCWLLLLEEYGVTFEYLPGKMHTNVVANALDFSQDQETTASVISNHQFRCIFL